MKTKMYAILRQDASKICRASLVKTIRMNCLLFVALMSISFFVEHAFSQSRKRAPKSKGGTTVTPSPSPIPQIQSSDGITSAYDESGNTTLVVSKEILLYDDANEGAVNPLRITMHLVTTYSGRASASSQAATDPLVKLLFNYRYFVPKFDVGDPRDFAIFTGLSTLEASGHLSFVRRDKSGNDVITTMQAAIRASEFDKILQKLKTSRSVSMLLGRDSFLLTTNHLDLFAKFLATIPHPQADTAQTLSPVSKCDLTVAQSPALRGFRLGEELEQVLRHFPGLDTREMAYNATTQARINRSSLDVILGTYYALTPQTPAAGHKITDTWNEILADSRFFPDFAGVAKLHLEFIDKQVVAIRVEYKDEIRWQTVDEFVAASASALGLSTQWKTGSLLTCVGFTLQASSSFRPSLEIRDTAAEAAARQREVELRKKEEDKRKSIFKP